MSKWLGAYARLEAELGERPAFSFDKARLAAGGTPAALARAARQTVKVPSDAAIHDICGLLAGGAVKILLFETKRDSFFGLSVGQRDSGPAVVLARWEGRVCRMV